MSKLAEKLNLVVADCEYARESWYNLYYAICDHCEEKKHSNHLSVCCDCNESNIVQICEKCLPFHNKKHIDELLNVNMCDDNVQMVLEYLFDIDVT